MSALEAVPESPISDDLAEALRYRYGHHVPDLGAHGNDILAHLLAHRSIRGYTTDSAPPNTVEALVARRAVGSLIVQPADLERRRSRGSRRCTLAASA